MEKSTARSLVCLALVALLHFIAVGLFLSHRSSHTNPPELVSTLWLVPEQKPIRPEPKVESKPKSTNKPSQHVAQSNSTAPAPATTLTIEQTPVTKSNEVEPHLDLDALRATAMQEELKREKSAVEKMNDRRKTNTSLESGVEKATDQAQKSDCRTAHAGAGLFAPLMIAADLVRDKGCKF